MLKGIQGNEKGLMDLQYLHRVIFSLGGASVLSLKLGNGRHFPVATPFVHSSFPTFKVLPLLLPFPLSHLPQVLPLPSMPFPQLPRT